MIMSGLLTAVVDVFYFQLNDDTLPAQRPSPAFKRFREILRSEEFHFGGSFGKISFFPICMIWNFPIH